MEDRLTFRQRFDSIVQDTIETVNIFDCIGHRRAMSKGESLALDKLKDLLEYHGAREALDLEDETH